MKAIFLAALCAVMFTMVPTASAATYTEIGDASQTIGTAQPVNSMPGGTALTAIFGTLEAGKADLFQIFLTGGQTFSATTVNGTTFIDTELFLFNGAGLGVYANDDDPNNPPQSTLPASISLTPSASGIFYLAIAGSGYLPVSGPQVPSGYIFPVAGGLLDQTGGIQGAVGPTGAGGASPLTGWSSTSSENGAYEIDLTGAQFVPTAVPEPSTALLLGSGLLIAGALRRRLVR